LYDARKCTLQKVDQKYLERFEMGCWGRKEKFGDTDGVRKEEVLHRAKEDRNIVQRIKIMKDNWIGHILRRDCLLKRDIEGKI
jgi:hypothetical protein